MFARLVTNVTCDVSYEFKNLYFKCVSVNKKTLVARPLLLTLPPSRGSQSLQILEKAFQWRGGESQTAFENDEDVN